MSVRIDEIESSVAAETRGADAGQPGAQQPREPRPDFREQYIEMMRDRARTAAEGFDD